jgi:predicted RNase H-like nuclease
VPDSHAQFPSLGDFADRKPHYTLLMTVVAGVDGCPKGWIAIVLTDGRFARAVLGRSFAELLPHLADAEVIAVDIPIGLPEGPDPRPADVEARKLLGKRASSVFTTPPRAVLEAPTYTEANRLSRRRFESGISAQSYALRRKIFEVDAVAAEDERIYEVHPELSFAAMNGAPVHWSKKTWQGQATRLHLLEAAGIIIPADLGPAGASPPDDVLDAAAAAWSASRIAASRSKRVGNFSLNGRPNHNAGFIWY